MQVQFTVTDLRDFQDQEWGQRYLLVSGLLVFIQQLDDQNI